MKRSLLEPTHSQWCSWRGDPNFCLGPAISCLLKTDTGPLPRLLPNELHAAAKRQAEMMDSKEPAMDTRDMRAKPRALEIWQRSRHRSPSWGNLGQGL